MVYRYSWLIGAAASILAFSLLNSLLKPTTQGLPWQIVVGGGLILGIVISWTTAVYRTRTWLTVAIHAVLMAVVAMRIGAPDTMIAILPTGATWGLMGTQLSQALDFIQNGVEPVIPVTGLVIILTLVLWAMGGLLGWGLSTGHPFVGLLPPFVLTLQFATMDRQPTSAIRVSTFVVLAILAMLAVTRDEETGAGRMYRRNGSTAWRNGIAPASGVLGATIIAALLAVTLLTPVVPRDGILDWRNPTGLTGDFFGSISFNPFVGIQQSLVDPTGQPVFFARIEGDIDPGDVYFRLVTMDSYSGGRFFANDPDVIPLDDGLFEYRENQFFGPTYDVTTTVTIAALAQEWLPAAYAPSNVTGSDQLEANLRIRPDDASINLDGGRSGEGLTYTVESDIPRPDLAALASTERGRLSRAFLEARDTGSEPVPLATLPEWRDEPASNARYVELPDPDLDNRLDSISKLALDVTTNLETDFEKALALESWFHSPFTGDGSSTDGFGYTTDILPGYEATDLAAWLLDEDSPNYHQGYCENFATAMAVMARSLGIRSRVVLGFTPGVASRDGPEIVVVTDENAHAWVEAWMPQQGWVRFDPTPRTAQDTPQTFEYLEDELGFSMQEYLDLPDPDFETAANQRPIFDPDAFADQDVFIGAGGADPDSGGLGISLPGWLPQLLWIFAAAALVFGSIPLMKWAGRRRRMRRLRTGDISAAWEELVARLTDLGERPSPTATAREVADDFDPVLSPLASIYDRSIYGPVGAVSEAHVETAAVTLERTESILVTRYSRGERLRALYRPGTILPGWWKRFRERQR